MCVIVTTIKEQHTERFKYPRNATLEHKGILKMKQKISVSIDEKKLELVKHLLEEGKFRSKSHVLEYSLNKLLKEELEDGK